MFCLESVLNCPLGIIKSSESESENSLENKNKQSDEEQVSSKCHQAQQIRNLEFCLVWTVTSCSLSHQLAAILRGHCAIIRAFIVKHYLKKKKKKKVYPKVNLWKVFPWKWVVTSTTLVVVKFSDTFQGFWHFLSAMSLVYRDSTFVNLLKFY